MNETLGRGAAACGACPAAANTACGAAKIANALNAAIEPLPAGPILIPAE